MLHSFAQSSVVLVAVVLVSMLPPDMLRGQQENSTRKIRIRPSDFAAQCGSAVQWRDSLDDAFAESESSGKPVFWYVPTIRGTFMDRKPEIDRYMLSGPFSWPTIAETINNEFIPVRSVASGNWQRKFELTPFKFVEPGFLVIESSGEVTLKVDQLTTLQPYWLLDLIAGSINENAKPLHSHELEAGWNALQQGNYNFDIDSLAVDASHAAEKSLLRGMLEFRRGKHEAAREIWKRAKELQPDHPLAWKAAAEAENWGPFVRGFEYLRSIPRQALDAGIESRGSAAPRATYTEDQIWQRSVDFLVSMQQENGGWFDSDYDFGGTDSLPNVYVAVSALCGTALLDALPRFPERQAELLDSIERAASFCSNTDHLNYFDSDEALWAHAYRVRFFAKLIQRGDEEKSKYTAALAAAVTDLEKIQTTRGSWYHEYANPFVTATALVALKQAQSCGATVDQEKIERGLKSLANDRFDNGAYPYSNFRQTRTRGGAASSGAGKIPESAGRMPLCELALWLWEASDDSRLEHALNASFEHHQHLNVAYKYDNHTSRMGYGGFFFWYDMRSRADAISHVRDRQKRDEFSNQHRRLVVDLPELDGCFVDSHELGRCYGTAMALNTLATLDRLESND